MDGLEAAEQIHKSTDIPIIFLTAYADEKTLSRAKITKPFGYILKPFEERELHSTIQIAIYNNRIERELKESKIWLHAALNSIGDAVIATDKEGTIKLINPYAEALTGWNKEEATGKNIKDGFNVVSELTGKEVEDPINKVICEGNFYGLAEDTVLIAKGGTRKPVDIIGNCILDEKNNILGVILVFNDIQERKNLENLRRQNDRIACMSKAKSEFLANMSHELRTPLNAIIGFSELLKMKIWGELNDKQAQYIDNVLVSSKHLLNLISDILDLSKVESGKMELIIEKISVPEFVNESFIFFKDNAAKRNIVLTKELDTQLNVIEADKLRLKQILFNLVSNAIKFSKQEGGTVTIKTKKSGDMAQFSVSDSGIGINEGDIGKLFLAFEQLDAGANRKYGGTGLGLMISKKLVELHSGKIMVESKYGEGSTFTFSIPIVAKKVEI